MSSNRENDATGRVRAVPRHAVIRGYTRLVRLFPNTRCLLYSTAVHTIYSTRIQCHARWLPSSRYTYRTTSTRCSSPRSDSQPYTTSPRPNSHGSSSGRRVGMRWDRASASGGAFSFFVSPFVHHRCYFCCFAPAGLLADWGKRGACPDLLLTHCTFHRQSRVASLVHALLILPLAARCLHLPALAADRAFGWDPRVGTLIAVTSG